MSSTLEFDKNENKNIWLEVRDRDNQAFSISGASFVVLREGGGVQAHRNCGIDGHRIYGRVDTTPAIFETDITYEARFTIIIGVESYIEKVYFRVK